MQPGGAEGVRGGVVVGCIVNRGGEFPDKTTLYCGHKKLIWDAAFGHRAAHGAREAVADKVTFVRKRESMSCSDAFVAVVWQCGSLGWG